MEICFEIALPEWNAVRVRMETLAAEMIATQQTRLQTAAFFR